MQDFREFPGTRIHGSVAIGLGVAALTGMGWVGWRVDWNADGSHTYAFIGLAALLGLAFYCAWLAWALYTVQYELTEGRLTLRQSWSHREVDLADGVRLHRWRSRWAWSGGVQKDLGVAEVELFPPAWPGRQAWVLVFPAGAGGSRAVAFCPSPELLARIKEWMRDTHGLAV